MDPSENMEPQVVEEQSAAEPVAAPAEIQRASEAAAQNEEILQKYSKEDAGRKLGKVVNTAVDIIALGISLFLLWTALFGSLPALRQRAVFLLGIMTILFLIYPAFAKRSQKGVPWYDCIFSAASFVACGYVVLQYEPILLRMGISNRNDQIVFVVLTILILEGTRRLVSGALSLITIIFLLYAYFGHLMPGIFRIKTGGISRIADHMLMIPEGIFGSPLGSAATYVSLFVIFSALMQASGLGEFIQDMAMALTGRSAGGPAKVAIFASALFGTVSGGAAANVVATGSFTIPLMKRTGYPPQFAAATEACASTGGQLVPPVMGAACFIMSEYIGVPYATIMVAALIPGFLFYLSVFLTVHMRAHKMGLLGLPKEQLPDAWSVLKERGHLIIPFIAVIVLIIRQYTISFAALVGIALVILMAQIRKLTRMSFKTIVNAFIDGGRRTISFGVSCACVGLIIGVTTLTGIGITLGDYILQISQGNLLLSLFLVMIMSIIMGMGMPTVAVYIVLATVAAPVLVKLGLPVLASHMFCFYFGILACVTPPVAVPSYAAAAIADCNPSSAGWAAFKMALPSFLIPYVFVYSPAMLMVDSTVFQVLQVAVTATMGVFMFVVGFEGFIVRTVPLWKRVLMFAGALLAVTPETFSDLLGIAIFLFVVVPEVVHWRKAKAAVALA